MMNTKLISVIIPTYNRSETLPTAIDSTLFQTFPPCEIIIVDDGSNDGTASFIKRVYGPRIKYRYQENKGVSSARNHGIREAKGEWIAFLDSDDWWLPQKLERQIQEIAKRPETKIIHTNEIWLRNGKKINQHKHHQKYGGWIFSKNLPLCLISPSSVMIHRSIFEEIGLFNTELPVCEDYDLWIRITSRYPVNYIEEKLIVKRGGRADQLSRALPIMDYYRVKSLYDFLINKEDKDIQFAEALNMMREKTRIILKGAKKHDNPDIIEKLRFAEEFIEKNKTHIKEKRV